MCEPRLGDLDPREDQKARVIDHQRQVLLAELRCPSDEVIARRELPGGGGEAEHGQRPAVSVMDGVAHLGADQGLVAEIVVAGDELVPELPFPGVTHDGAEVERANLVEGGRRREQRGFGIRPEDDGLGAALPSPRRREHDDAVAMHGEHGDLGPSCP